MTGRGCETIDSNTIRCRTAAQSLRTVGTSVAAFIMILIMIGGWSGTASAQRPADGDVVAALVNLGYRQAAASRAVTAADRKSGSAGMPRPM